MARFSVPGTSLATVALVFATLITAPAGASDSECWIAGGFEGRSANASNLPSEGSDGYKFINETFADGMLICFDGNRGHVTNNDLELIRFGESTLVGWAENGRGLETVNTYQLDRERGKLLFTQSRIGTATVIRALPDYAAAFVGNAVRVPK